jgi:3-deoxy-7-phosphoheptulonate synthase
MIVILKPKYEQKQLDDLCELVKGFGLKPHLVVGENQTILGLIGNDDAVDMGALQSIEIVESVKRISEPYKRASRKFHPDDTVIEIRGRKVGGNNFVTIGGPCSIESEEQIIGIAESVKAAGGNFLRGGAYKPRTSPYAFQGMRQNGIELLLKARDKTGLPVVTEIMDACHIDQFKDVDIIQVGARSMQNFEMLKALGKIDKPILLKRGLANTIEELLMSAEYILAGGNNKVILCERGIRTFETYTRNTLDLQAVSLLKQLTHLPVIVDPSHAAGIASLVPPMSLAAAVCGADGLIIEVHNDPSKAACDGAQCIKPDQFAEVIKKIDVVLPVTGKKRVK